MMCPGPEQAAAYADGRLDAADAARYLEHCSECDDCRRTLAILSLPRESVGAPPDVEARAIAAMRRSLGAERERSATRPIRRVAPPPAAAPRAQKSTVGFVIAACLLAGFVGLVLMAKQPTPRVPSLPARSSWSPPPPRRRGASAPGGGRPRAKPPSPDPRRSPRSSKLPGPRPRRGSRIPGRSNSSRSR
jgi:hypothetical protein